jgi:hypothetical protein
VWAWAGLGLGLAGRGYRLEPWVSVPWRDANKKSVCDDKFDRIAAPESDSRKAHATKSAQCGWPNQVGFSSENTLNVLARASLFIAFRARLEFINASRHAFKTAKNCLIP